MTTSKFGYEISDEEYFYNLTDIVPVPDKIYANVPKLMPRIAVSKPSKNKDSINTGIFINHSECKPQPSKTITTQNFITIEHQPNEHPDYTYKMDRTTNMVPKFNRFLLNVLHNDIRKIYFNGRM